MPQYDIYLPLQYNDGRPIEPEKFEWTRRELLDRFGGFSVIPAGEAMIEGWWQLGNDLYRDDLRIFRVVTAIHDAEFWTGYKEELKQRFEQEKIFIVRSEAQVL